MGQVEEAGELTEQELRDIAIRSSFEALDNEAIPLAPNEFTLKQWIDLYKEDYGVELSDTTARRKLDKLIAEGKIQRGKRKNLTTGHACIAYWEAE